MRMGCRAHTAARPASTRQRQPWKCRIDCAAPLQCAAKCVWPLQRKRTAKCFRGTSCTAPCPRRERHRAGQHPHLRSWHPPGEWAASSRARYLASLAVSWARSLLMSASFLRSWPCRHGGDSQLLSQTQLDRRKETPLEAASIQIQAKASSSGSWRAGMKEVGGRRLGRTELTHACSALGVYAHIIKEPCRCIGQSDVRACAQPWLKTAAAP